MLVALLTHLQAGLVVASRSSARSSQQVQRNQTGKNLEKIFGRESNTSNFCKPGQILCLHKLIANSLARATPLYHG